MENLTCVRLLHFDAGHRLVNHQGKCAKLHGHRYTCEVHCEAPELDSLGMVVDFGVVKQKIGGWIDSNWDHNVVLSKEDAHLGDFIFETFGQKAYFLNVNPTAENMALHLLNEVCPVALKGSGVVCVKIRLWETPNCFVDVSLKDAS